MIKVLFLLYILVFNAHANSMGKDTSIPEILPTNFSELQFKEVGKAKFSVLFWDIYNSSLYTKSGAYSHSKPSESLIFKIVYLKDITTEDLLERTIEQWQHLQVPVSQYSLYVPILKAMWPDISSGDSLTMLVDNNLSIFYLNHKKIGVIEQQEFSKLFLDIWLSPNTSQLALRNKLLNGNIKE